MLQRLHLWQVLQGVRCNQLQRNDVPTTSCLTLNLPKLMNYKLKIKNNHLSVQLASGCWLIDTGSPMSFGAGVVDTGHEKHQVPTSLLGLTLGKLQEFVGQDYVGLLGVDILNRYACHFDVPNGKMTFFKEAPSSKPGKRVALDQVMGVPLLDAEVDGQTQRLIFDTGAQYSYLKNIDKKSEDRVGRGRDFHPMLGNFDIEFFLKKLGIGSIKTDIQVASNPDVTVMCQTFKADGILGLEPLRNHPALYLPKTQELWI